MSLFPAYFGARKRADDDAAPPAEPDDADRGDVFNLIPPRAEDRAAGRFARHDDVAEGLAEMPLAAMPHEQDPDEQDNDNDEANALDLSRLSIDDAGNLYWDGKPVEVRRRLTLSRAQVLGVSLIAFFIVIGALGSVLQAVATMHEWACRAGLASSCAAAPAPPAPAAPPRVDIPA